MTNLNNTLVLKTEKTFGALRPTVGLWNIKIKSDELGKEPTESQFKEMKEEIFEKIKGRTDYGFYSNSIELKNLFAYDEEKDEDFIFSGFAYSNKENNEIEDQSRFIINVPTEKEKTFLLEFNFKAENKQSAMTQEEFNLISLNEKDTIKVNNDIEFGVLSGSLNFNLNGLDVSCNWKVIKDLGFLE